ncbi:hypothetical protein [Euzebya tangerina]|uniref:hypothetical protein n=1 Tax=Euzebya tangerina TaxID=591198 RepID=UPI000E316A41|nr:hypothetical protein [Euzebya tangerina]
MNGIGPIRSERGALTVIVTVVGAVLAPIANQFRAAPRDSFPFSHYPMFSARRGHDIGLSFVRGVRADGTFVPLDSRLAARGGMNQERKQLAAAARRRTRARKVASRVARRIARRDLHLDVVAVEFVRGRFLLAQYFDDAPLECHLEEVRGFAVVPGRPGDDVAPDLQPSGNCPPSTPAPPRRRPAARAEGAGDTGPVARPRSAP